MCFKDKEHSQNLESEKNMVLHTTRYNVLIPIFISASAFFVEIYSVYYVAKEPMNWLSILRLLNTTFVPTHIATTIGFLYQHFSLVINFGRGGKIRSIDDMEIKAEHAGLIAVCTIILAFCYVVFSFGVVCVTQIILLVMQCVYIWILVKYGLRDRILICEKTIKNVVSY